MTEEEAPKTPAEPGTKSGAGKKIGIGCAVLLVLVPLVYWLTWHMPVVSARNELIPLLDKNFRTDARRESRAILGQDFYGGAGFAAMYLALHHPEVVSRAAAQSYEHAALKDDILAAASGAKHDLDLVFHWSSHDRFYPFWDFDARRDAENMVATLQDNGYRPKVIESDDGFGWGMWQGRMAEILEALFPLQ